MKILCVDDERTTLALVSRSLEKAFPQDVILASASPQEALRILKDENVEILITDLMMPGHSGMELLERAKRDHPDIEVIMVTAFSSVDSAVQAMQKGARDYLPKPLSVELLVEKVQNLRELLVSRREVNDYRYALRVIEEDVTRSALTLERRLGDLRAQMGRIREILAAGMDAERKLSLIAGRISELEKAEVD